MDSETQKALRIYRCEDSVVGILSAIYDAGVSGYGNRFIRIHPLAEGAAEELELFAEYVSAQTDLQKGDRVLAAVKNKISVRAYDMMLYALAADAPDRASAVYQFLTYGFAMGAPVCDAMQIPCVKRVRVLHKAVQSEEHSFREFLRFQEVPGETPLLFGVLEPRHRILPMLTAHFADRLPEEWFLIYDRTHREAALHMPQSYAGQKMRGGKAADFWEIRCLTKEETAKLEQLTETHGGYADLWRTFLENITIAERTNPRLQKSLLPLHYRKHMTEFL